MKLDYRRFWLHGLASWLAALWAFRDSTANPPLRSDTHRRGDALAAPSTLRLCPRIRPPFHSVMRRG